MEYKSKYTASEIDAKLSQVFDSTLQTKAVEVSEDTTITADDGFLGLKEVNVKVKGGGSGSGSTIEYRDVSGIKALTRANLVAEIAFMAKFSMDGTTLTCFATQAMGVINMVGGDGVISISTDLNAKTVTHSSDGSFSATAKETLIQRGWWEEYNSCPIITEEEFYA